MLIELDLMEAKRLKITVNQFILITLLMEQFDIKAVLDVIPVSESDINNLIDKGILTKESVFDSNDFTKIEITSDFKKKLAVRDFFQEFYDAYPVSIIRSDGLKDYLRGDVSRCRKYYSKIVGKSLSKHEHMMTCLKFDVNNRKRTNSLAYMKRMSKWLLSEEWLIYEESIKEIADYIVEEGYGTDVE
jgi:hypothetical protein